MFRRLSKLTWCYSVFVHHVSCYRWEGEKENLSPTILYFIKHRHISSHPLPLHPLLSVSPVLSFLLQRKNSGWKSWSNSPHRHILSPFSLLPCRVIPLSAPSPFPFGPWVTHICKVVKSSIEPSSHQGSPEVHTSTHMVSSMYNPPAEQLILLIIP